MKLKPQNVNAQPEKIKPSLDVSDLTLKRLDMSRGDWNKMPVNYRELVWFNLFGHETKTIEGNVIDTIFPIMYQAINGLDRKWTLDRFNSSEAKERKELLEKVEQIFLETLRKACPALFHEACRDNIHRQVVTLRTATKNVPAKDRLGTQPASLRSKLLNIYVYKLQQWKTLSEASKVNPLNSKAMEIKRKKAALTGKSAKEKAALKAAQKQHEELVKAAIAAMERLEQAEAPVDSKAMKSAIEALNAIAC